MADDKGPARERVTRMTKISIKDVQRGLPQGNMVTRGCKDKKSNKIHKFEPGKLALSAIRICCSNYVSEHYGEREEN